MKYAITLATLTSAALLATGCNQSDNSRSQAATNSTLAADGSTSASNSWQDTKETGTNAWQAVKATGSNAWQSAKDAFGASTNNEIGTNFFGYDFSLKSKFLAEAGANLDKLDKLDKKTSKISSQVANVVGDNKANLQSQLRDITDRRTEAGHRYEAAQNASQDTWADARAAFVKAYFDLKATVKAAEDSLMAQM